MSGTGTAFDGRYHKLATDCSLAVPASDGYPVYQHDDGGGYLWSDGSTWYGSPQACSDVDKQLAASGSASLPQHVKAGRWSTKDSAWDTQWTNNDDSFTVTACSPGSIHFLDGVDPAPVKIVLT